MAGRQPPGDVEGVVRAESGAGHARGLGRVERREVGLLRFEKGDSLFETGEDPLAPVAHRAIVGIRPEKQHGLVEPEQASGVGIRDPRGFAEPADRVASARPPPARVVEAIEHRVDAARHGAHATSI